ncbi:sulfatase-like hydrolase/transferase [Aeoliella sp. SH292]|uniref:sulfatase-like hydrolase/transferase n=1 Tax=Aeoliella sp. SH292 TaxID=3454464 RepID=UPI003F97FFEC
MDSRVVIVVMVDGLRARALGAYGNTSYSTPALDKLASESLAFDRFFSESTTLADAYDALWRGRHALDSCSIDGDDLIARLIANDYLCHLVTDEPEVASRPESEQFDQVTLVEWDITDPATEVFDTAMGRTIEAAADVLGEWSAEYEQPRLLWLHLKGMTAPWDAPTDLPEELRDEDDPELVPTIEVPQGEIAEGDDGLDEAFVASCRYAGQVMALDQAIGALDRLLAELWPETPATLVLAGVRGFGLGEHGRLGIDGPAHRELFHVPLLVRSPGVPGLRRDAALVQTSDLHAILTSLTASDTLSVSGREVAGGKSGDSSFLETEDWSYVVPSPDEAPQLFVAPDDAWQANNIASRCHEQLEEFAHLRQAIDTAAQQGRSWKLLELDPTPEPSTADD